MLFLTMTITCWRRTSDDEFAWQGNRSRTAWDSSVTQQLDDMLLDEVDVLPKRGDQVGQMERLAP